MCTVILPPGVKPIAVNKYEYIISLGAIPNQMYSLYFLFKSILILFISYLLAFVW